MQPDYLYKATILKISDGDTLTANVDLGFRMSAVMTFRLYGVNTPEVVGEQRPQGLKAKTWVESQLPVGSPIVIQTFKDEKEKYGRYLAEVFYGPGFNLDLNKGLLEQGLAKAYFGVGSKT